MNGEAPCSNPSTPDDIARGPSEGQTGQPSAASSPPSSASSRLLPLGPRRAASALALPETLRGRLSDREFLAPALEILETPASPVHVAFLWIICALVVVGLALVLFRPHRHHRLGPGQVSADRPGQGDRAARDRAGRRHPVANGSSVEEGDVLVELDRSAAEADRDRREGGARLGPRRDAAAAGGARGRESARLLSAAVDRLARRHRASVARARRTGARGRPRAARGDARLVRRPAGAEDRRARHADPDDRDPEEPGRDAAGARRHAHQARRVAVRRQVRRDRRDRDPAIPADPARDPGAAARLRCRPAST